MSAEAVKTLVQAFISCRLDYCNSLFYGITVHRRSDEPAAVCPECGCTFGVGRWTVRPHHANATGAALASSSTPGRYQDLHPGLPVTVRHGSSLSGRRLPVGLRRRSSSAAFCHIEDVRCEANLQYSNYGDRCFAAARPKLWNNLPTELQQADISFQRFKRLLKTILFGC